MVDVGVCKEENAGIIGANLSNLQSKYPYLVTIAIFKMKYNNKNGKGKGSSFQMSVSCCLTQLFVRTDNREFIIFSDRIAF